MHGHREGTAICTSRREASGGTRPADTLSLAFQSQRGGWGGEVPSLLSPLPVWATALWQPRTVQQG